MKTDFDGRKLICSNICEAKEKVSFENRNDDYGGSGIVLGWESSTAVWETAWKMLFVNHLCSGTRPR